MDGGFVAFSHNTLLHKHSTQHDLLRSQEESIVYQLGHPFNAFSHNSLPLLPRFACKNATMAKGPSGPMCYRRLSYLGHRYFIIVTPHDQFIIHESDFSSPSTKQSPYLPRAFVAYLQGYSESNSTASDDEDVYYLGTRVLGYQLMHAPKNPHQYLHPLCRARHRRCYWPQTCQTGARRGGGYTD